MASDALGPKACVQLTIGFDRKQNKHYEDCYVLVHEEEADGKLTLLGRTNDDKEGSKVRFSQGIVTSFFFERAQKLRFTLQAYRNSRVDTKTHGFATTPLAQIMSSGGSTVYLPLNNNRGDTLIISGEEVSERRSNVTFQMEGRGLDKKDFFGKSDPYYIMYRFNSKQQREVAYKSEVIMKTLDPMWKPVTLSSHQLCYGDVNRHIIVEVYDWDNNSDHDLIGMFSTTLAELEGGKREFAIINPKKQDKKGYTNSGVATFSSFRSQNIPTFLQYLAGGLEINVVVAVDFTGSNGNPNDPNSLHSLAGNNQYERAIRSVLQVLEHYDADKQLPVFGFGARLPNGQISFDFNVSLTENPFLGGIENVVGAYYNCLRQVTLYGPTDFAPIIRKASALAAHSKSHFNSSKYFVLLLLTDGEVTDYKATVESIQAACQLPLSIVIAGIGQADFGKMEKLDGDRTQIAARDIVQFAAMRDVGNDSVKLATTILAEIPQQVVSYMTAQNIAPKPPRAAAPFPMQ